MSAEQIPILGTTLSLSLPNQGSPKRISRDEMNLAEFPLTILSTRASLPGKGTEVKTLEFSDQVRGKNGEIVNRQWIITGADKFGLPTSSDDEVLLGLLKLTVNTGFMDRKVYFSRYELLKILKWTTEGRSYARLQKALDRLSGVRIKATNAFFDNETKSHSTRNFGLIDAYEINDGRDLGPKPSFFIWSEALFKSYKVGFIKKFDLDFYLDLKSAVSKRLFRYLDKHFWYRSKIQIGLFTLAHEKVGISRNYVYASSLRQQLDPAVSELKDRGFLADYEFVGKGRETEIILYAASGKPRVTAKNSAEGHFAPGTDASSNIHSEDSQGDTYHKVFGLLVDRGLKEQQVLRLLTGRTEEVIARIRDIIQYFDSLCSTGSHLVSRSPVGFLYRAVENPENFVLPGDDSVKKASQTKFDLGGSSHLKDRVKADGMGKRAPVSTTSNLESEYLIARKLAIKEQRDAMDLVTLRRIESEVETALLRLKGHITDQRFKETVAHGVDEKIAKLFALPSFEEWLRER